MNVSMRFLEQDLRRETRILAHSVLDDGNTLVGVLGSNTTDIVLIMLLI